MKSLVLEKANLYKGNLILINKTHAVSDEFIDNDFVSISSDYPTILINHEAAVMYAKLIASLKSAQNIVLVSGYRTFAEQQKIYYDSMAENGEEFTSNYVALPNHSEHQTGLAIDVGIAKEDIDFIRPEFPYTGISQKFREKAPMYGFIERYPCGKTDITGIAHEPWHFRYVGFPHSYVIQQKEITLEEYIEYIKGFSYNKSHLHLKIDEQFFEIFYVEASSTFPIYLQIPSNDRYQVSGDNATGFIVTIWRRDG